RRLARVAEWGMPDVVNESNRLRKVFVEVEEPRDGTGDLGSFQCVRQPGPVVIALVVDENLCLVLEPAKRPAVDDPIPVPLERRPERTLRLGIRAPARLRCPRCERRQQIALTIQVFTPRSQRRSPRDAAIPAAIASAARPGSAAAHT